jgi:AbrB family looped-hinge helix DNA binding protein
MPTTVTSKGQVTIPKPIREHLGIRPGSAVVFELAPDGRVVLSKPGAARPPSRFEALRGRAGPGLSTDEIMALTRGENGHDPG